MHILKVNTYAPDTALYQAFGPDVVFDIHRSSAEATEPPSLERCRAADAVINCAATLQIGVPVEAFERCKIVVREGVGYDTLDLAGWGARGVPVCNVPDYGTTEVADHALGLLLSLTRGTTSYQEAVRDRTDGWHYAAAPLVRRLRGQTFAVLGLGRIGLATARRAAAFDMKVIFYDPYLPNGAELAVGYERVRSLDEVMARADILSVHTPLTEETRGMVGAAALAKAKPELIVINTARGPIVDLDALAEALKAGRIAGAGLDVLPREPADPDHPLIKAFRAREPWTEGKLSLTPHSAFYSPSALEDMQRKAIEVIVTYLREGVLMNCVNQEFLRTKPQAS
ncbi:C-terminal binding protein [Mesorhizobium sp. LHD-90]|uniref:C-terminal binding protein n=1 Tax=Mesorhizobium sp. LHD-90 TaxID=3071414 RepID=UPI0027E0C786|nr:C-terminal binding protein [Mesorhizobium sp. LHD-90]MDQ6435356.1 C-terminal binding protein [Mesorhizobium sp. LHD-90]